jgi:thiol:disulfide interchange protein
VKWDCKQNWLDAAEVFDAWRIVPRIIVTVFLVVFAWAVVYFSMMYFRLPAGERTVAMTAFVSVVLTALTTALPFIVKIYTDNGRDWTGTSVTASSTSTKVSTETVTK